MIYEFFYLINCQYTVDEKIKIRDTSGKYDIFQKSNNFNLKCTVNNYSH